MLIIYFIFISIFLLGGGGLTYLHPKHNTIKNNYMYGKLYIPTYVPFFSDLNSYNIKFLCTCIFFQKCKGMGNYLLNSYSMLPPSPISAGKYYRSHYAVHRLFHLSCVIIENIAKPFSKSR